MRARRAGLSRFSSCQRTAEVTKNQKMARQAKKDPSNNGARTLPCGRPLPPSAPPPSPSKLAEWQEQLRAYLTKEGLKYTEQRWAIAQLILESGGHLDPQ